MSFVVEPCASAKAYEIKFGRAIDLHPIAAALEKEELLISRASVVLLCKINSRAVSIYASGRAMVKECTKKEAEAIAAKLETLIH